MRREDDMLEEKDTRASGDTQAGAFMTAERQEQIAEERERVKSIFTFLKGMAELKTTSVLDIDKQPWKKYVAVDCKIKLHI